MCIPSQVVLLLLVFSAITSCSRFRHLPNAVYRLLSSESAPHYLGAIHVTVTYGKHSTSMLGEPVAGQLTKEAAKIIEGSRRLIANGSNLIPPLDPLHVDRLPQIEIDRFISGTLELWNLNVHGMQHFHVNSLAVRGLARRIDFDVTLPLIKIDSQYNLQAKSILGLVSYEPRGQINVQCKAVRLRGHVTVDLVSPPDANSHLKITGLQYSLDVGSVEFTFNGLMVSDRLSNSMTSLVRFFSHGKANGMISKKANKATASAIRNINKKLEALTVTKILRKVAFG